VIGLSRPRLPRAIRGGSKPPTRSARSTLGSRKEAFVTRSLYHLIAGGEARFVQPVAAPGRRAVARLRLVGRAGLGPGPALACLRAPVSFHGLTNAAELLTARSDRRRAPVRGDAGAWGRARTVTFACYYVAEDEQGHECGHQHRTWTAAVACANRRNRQATRAGRHKAATWLAERKTAR